MNEERKVTEILKDKLDEIRDIKKTVELGANTATACLLCVSSQERLRFPLGKANHKILRTQLIKQNL
jgi:hypothetical protein